MSTVTCNMYNIYFVWDNVQRYHINRNKEFSDARLHLTSWLSWIFSKFWQITKACILYITENVMDAMHASLL